MSKKVLAILAVGMAMLMMTTAANATVTIDAYAVPGPYNLTTLGSTDWEIFNNVDHSTASAIGDPTRKNIVTPLLTNITGGNSQWNASGPQFTFSDGTGGLTSPTKALVYNQQGGDYTFTAPSDSNLHTLTVFIGGYRENNTDPANPGDVAILAGTLSGGGSASATWKVPTYDWTYGAYTITYSSDTAQTLTVSIQKASGSQESGFSAAALQVTPAPEPMTMSLLVIGGIGALLRCRRAAQLSE